MRILYLASNNRHKQQEFAAMVGTAFDVRLARDLKPDLDWNETGKTFADNARIKAMAVRAHTQAAVLADDSGLEVEALSGAPGVLSSRYAGKNGDDRANNAKLLLELSGVPEELRRARFVCTLCFIDERGQEMLFSGTCEGRIIASHRGAHGFGYDPLFLVDGKGCTMAEMSEEEKNSLSHRRRAVDQWKQSLGLG